MHSLLSMLMSACFFLTSTTIAAPHQVDDQPASRKDLPSRDVSMPYDMLSGDNCFKTSDSSRCFLNANIYADGTNWFAVRGPTCFPSIDSGTRIDRSFLPSPNKVFKPDFAQWDITVTNLPLKDLKAGLPDLDAGLSFTVGGSAPIHAKWDPSIPYPAGLQLDSLVQDVGGFGIAGPVVERNVQCSYESQKGNGVYVDGRCYVIEYTCINILK